MRSERSKAFPQVDILSLGTYIKRFNFRANGKQPALSMKTFKRQRDFETVNKIAPENQVTRFLRHLLAQPPVLVPYTRNFDKASTIWEWF